MDKIDRDIRYVVKRSGDKVPFHSEKIEKAVIKAMKSIDMIDENMAEKIARITTKAIFRTIKNTFLMLMKYTIWWKIN